MSNVSDPTGSNPAAELQPYSYKYKFEYKPIPAMPYTTFTIGAVNIAWSEPSTMPVTKPEYIKESYFQLQAKTLTKQGVPDDSNVFLHIEDLCICGEKGGTHSGTPPSECYTTDCKGFLYINSTSGKETLKTPDIPPQSVLDLVKDSVVGDWHRHNNNKNQGWVYKTASVHWSATIGMNAVIYGKAKIGHDCTIADNTKIFDDAVIRTGCYVSENAKIGKKADIGSYSSIHGYSKIFGNVGSSSNISGKTYIREGIVVQPGSILKESPKEHRTQKAKGLSVLYSAGFKVPENKIYRIERLKTKQQLEKLLGQFVRPCPMTPRHGFVDSRSVATIDDAKTLIKETKLADTQAEFIVMPFIKASHSGIWTEGQLSIGTGNDGATSGRDSCVIPIQGIPQAESKTKWDSLLKSAGITESPYIELLWQNKHSNFNLMFVQLRNGPKLPNSVNFIPAKTKVTKVVLAEGDLLKWESDVKTFKPGTVVYHPGGSLASHYAVHAYLSNIPILIDKEPKVGDILEPDTTVLKSNINLLRKGFQLGCVLDCSYKQAAYIMMAGCHSTTQWLGRCDLLLGMSMGCCYRLLMAASLGEFRRRDSIVQGGGGADKSRETIYEEMWDIVLDKKTQDRFAAAMKSFDEEDWKGSSVGGVNWYILGRWGALIYNALLDGDEKLALESLNKGVNSVHNGGWTFNKFIEQREMDSTAKNPIYSLLKVAPILYDSAKISFVESKLEKYTIKEILDVDKYVEERKAQWVTSQKTSKIKSSINLSKKCCSKDCCGNPDCMECHPLVPALEYQYKSCPYYIEDGSIAHGGSEIIVYQNSMGWIFPVCQTHLNYYMSVPNEYKLYESTKPEPIIFDDLIQHKPEESGCNCLDHDCSDCYPDGCGCDSTDCHDCGNDCCSECNPYHDGDHCTKCYANSNGTCMNPNCEDCYPKTEPETETL